MTIAATDLFEVLALPTNRAASREEILAGRDRLAAYVTTRLRVTAGGTPCPAAPSAVTPLDGFAEVRFAARCPLAQPFGLEYDLFFELDPSHVGLAELRAGDKALTHEFRASARRFTWTVTTATGTPFLVFIGHGLEHIFTGYDHLAFLLALLLAAPGFGVRRGATHVLGVVTAFTAAHSITLILAGLDVVSAPSRIVEAAIAASIVFVAVENVWFGRADRPRARWPIAFGFGLVHGLGFAAMLRPLLPPSGIVVPLLAFNLGVELGQLAVVAAVLPGLLALRHLLGARYRIALLAGSAVIAAAGLYWLVERL